MNSNLFLPIIGLVALTAGLIALVIYEPRTAPVVLTIGLLMFIYAMKLVKR